MNSAIEWATFAVVLFTGLAVFFSLRWWNETRSPLAQKARQRIEESLQEIENPGPLLGDIRREGITSTTRRARLPVGRITRYLEEAGLGAHLERWLAAIVLWWILALAVGSILIEPQILRGILVVVLWIIPIGVVISRHDRLADALEKQIPEALDVMARSLQAGKALPTSWREMGEILDKPMAPLCRDIHLKLQYGGELEDILREASRRIPSEDLKFFFVSLIIQTRSGGNLIALLRDQSQLIRERIAMRDRIRALSAEGRLSAWLMGLMPFFVAGLMLLINPETMSLLWERPAGLVMMQTGLILQVIGALWIIRLVRIRV